MHDCSVSDDKPPRIFSLPCFVWPCTSATVSRRRPAPALTALGSLARRAAGLTTLSATRHGRRRIKNTREPRVPIPLTKKKTADDHEPTLVILDAHESVVEEEGREVPEGSPGTQTVQERVHLFLDGEAPGDSEEAGRERSEREDNERRQACLGTMAISHSL